MNVLKRYKICGNSLIIKIPSDYLKKEININCSEFFLTKDELSYIYIKDNIDTNGDFDNSVKKYIDILRLCATENIIVKKTIIDGYVVKKISTKISRNGSIFEYIIVFIDVMVKAICIILSTKQNDTLLWNKEMDYLIKTIRIDKDER